MISQARIEVEVKQEAKRDTPLKRTVRRFLKHRAAVLGLVILLILVFLAVFAPYVQRYGPGTINLRTGNKSPSGDHWFGTDRLGRDIWSRTIHGGRVSMAVGLVATLISSGVGVVLGSAAGYFGGWVDNVIMRFTDVMMTFPPIIIILVVVSLTGPGLWNVILILGFLSWPGVARLVRGQFLLLRSAEFVESAQALGAGSGKIIFQHILPNALAPVLVNASFAMAQAILTEAGLSFLGLGVPPPTPSWGNMLNVARTLDVLQNQPWQWVPPGLFTVICVLCINFVGDGLRDALDPRTIK